MGYVFAFAAGVYFAAPVRKKIKKVARQLKLEMRQSYPRLLK